MKNGYTRSPLMFKGFPGFIVGGYAVSQYKDGKKVAAQFLTEEEYEKFCQEIGTIPILEEEGQHEHSNVQR